MKKWIDVINYHPNSIWVWLATGLSLSIIFTSFQTFLPSGPDALLYKGLSQNLLNETGYVDTIRNDFILPTIGHPALLAGFSLMGVEDLYVSKALLFFGLFSFFIVFKLLRYTLFWSVALTFLTFVILPEFHVNGAEVSLLCAVALTLASILFHLKSQSLISGAVLGACILLFLLIRPLILPALWILVPLLTMGVCFRKAWRKPLIPALMILVIGYFGIKTISNQLYADSRMVSGTYGSITLYSGFNPYVNLETTYYSSLWRQIPEALSKEGLAPLEIKNNETWQDRDARLKSLVLSFIKNNPIKAVKAYWWRFQKFSLSADRVPYILLFFGWLIISFLVIKRRRVGLFEPKSLLTFSMIVLPLYLILIQALFVYAGYRYCLVSGLSLLFSIAYLIAEHFNLSSSFR